MARHSRRGRRPGSSCWTEPVPLFSDGSPERRTDAQREQYHALELETVTLRVQLENALDQNRDLRDRVQQLEAREERMARALRRAIRPAPPVAPAAPAAPAAPVGPQIGPRALQAIEAFAGRNRELGQHLMREALALLAADPALDDKVLAAKIVEGESPDMLDDDDELAAAAGRIIPGGSL